MDPIPENWPPTEPATQVLPIFPLQNVWLFPFMLLPLHVFEPRYRQMVEDCLDGPGRIVLGTLEDDAAETASGQPPFYPVAGLGEIGRHEKHEDGRFDMVLVGLHRVHLTEVESDRLYRKVEVRRAVEVPVPRERESRLRREVTAALKSRLDAELRAQREQRKQAAAELDLELPDIRPETPFAHATLSHLADLLSIRLSLPHAVLNELFSELDIEKRVQRALEEHAARPQAPGDDG